MSKEYLQDISDMDMSNKSGNFALLLAFGKIRRQLNLKVTQLLKPLGIGPKQAIFLREIHLLKRARLSDLAKNTFTDPAATGKAIDVLIKKGWVKRTDYPGDRRSWQVFLSEDGKKIVQKQEDLYKGLARDFSAPLSAQQRENLLRILNEISAHLDKLRLRANE